MVGAARRVVVHLAAWTGVITLGAHLSQVLCDQVRHTGLHVVHERVGRLHDAGHPVAAHAIALGGGDDLHRDVVAFLTGLYDLLIALGRVEDAGIRGLLVVGREGEIVDNEASRQLLASSAVELDPTDVSRVTQRLRRVRRAAKAGPGCALDRFGPRDVAQISLSFECFRAHAELARASLNDRAHDGCPALVAASGVAGGTAHALQPRALFLGRGHSLRGACLDLRLALQVVLARLPGLDQLRQAVYRQLIGRGEAAQLVGQRGLAGLRGAGPKPPRLHALLDRGVDVRCDLHPRDDASVELGGFVQRRRVLGCDRPGLRAVGLLGLAGSLCSGGFVLPSLDHAPHGVLLGAVHHGQRVDDELVCDRVGLAGIFRLGALARVGRLRLGCFLAGAFSGFGAGRVELGVTRLTAQRGVGGLVRVGHVLRKRAAQRVESNRGLMRGRCASADMLAHLGRGRGRLLRLWRSDGPLSLQLGASGRFRAPSHVLLRCESRGCVT